MREREKLNNQSGWEALACAVYEQAAEDYEGACKTIDIVHQVDVRHRTQKMLDKKESAESMKAECRKFFNDDPYSMLPNISGEQICLNLYLKALEGGEKL